MKDKRIWIVIGCILVIGSGVTYYTNSYVRSRGAGAEITAQTDAGLRSFAGTGLSGGINGADGTAVASAAGAIGGKGTADPPAGEGSLPQAATDEPQLQADSETDPLAGAPGSVSDTLISGRQAEGQAPAAAPYMAEDESSAWEGIEEAAAADAMVSEEGPEAAAVPQAASAPISPLTGAKIREEKAMQVSDYRQRLEDLDNQIQRMREEDTAETSSNVYSIRTSAETELKLWEGELGTIYNALLEMLSQEEAAALAAEQQEWLKNRDGKAAEGTLRSGSSVERLGYAATLVSLTRERAYELADRYEEANGILSETDQNLNPSDSAAKP